MSKTTNYKYILIDLDDTLLDFKKAEKFAFDQLLKYFKIKNSKLYFKKYHLINLKLWSDFEKGKVTKEALAIMRFKHTFKDIKPELDYHLMNQVFLSYIALASFPVEGSYELLKYLKKKYKVYVISNGIAYLQLQRLNHSRIMDHIDGFVFSEEANYPKPDLAYFKYFFKKYKLNFKQSDFVIIGDSVSSDIQSAYNLKIDSIWYNPQRNKSKLKPTYQVGKLLEITKLL